MVKWLSLIQISNLINKIKKRKNQIMILHYNLMEIQWNGLVKKYVYFITYLGKIRFFKGNLRKEC